jgi:ABC-2 type transport system ATP-binding protein
LVDEAEAADRVVVLHQGQVLAQGAPRALTAAAGGVSLADAFLAMTGGVQE